MLVGFVFVFDSLPSARQHSSYADYLEVKREYYQNCSVLDCVTQCSQSAVWAVLTGPTDWVCHIETLMPCILHRGGCLELYLCNMMEWFWWHSSLISTTDWFNRSRNDYNVLSWMLSKQPTNRLFAFELKRLCYY